MSETGIKFMESMIKKAESMYLVDLKENGKSIFIKLVEGESK